MYWNMETEGTYQETTESQKGNHQCQRTWRRKNGLKFDVESVINLYPPNLFQH